MLTSPAISPHEAERKFQELLYEFFLLFFTGGPVNVGANLLTFPALPKNTDILTHWLFGTAELIGHPEAWVHTVISDLRLEEDSVTATQKLVTGKAVLAIYVRAAATAKGFQDADFTCRAIADGIRQIIESEQQLLAQKDLHHVKVVRGPVPVAYPGAPSRMLVVNAQPMYRVDY